MKGKGNSTQPVISPDSGTAPERLIGIESLVKEFSVGKNAFGRKQATLRAVDNVSLEMNCGETFGLVGESGCGKTTIARCLMRLEKPSSGRIMFRNTDVSALRGKELRRFRRHMQMVFQDPHASLDSRMTASQIVGEPLAIHGIGSRAERRERVEEILTLVGIDPLHGNRKPHGFSGGQAQRIALARALILNPDMLVLDEPVSALDVSIQAQVLNFLQEIQERFSLTYLFIVHDLVVAEYFCDRIAVLYLGAVVEMAESRALFHNPLHPYTVSLVSAVPVPDPESRGRGRRIVLSGEVSPAGMRTEGCRFRARCPIGRNREMCKASSPELVEKSPGHWVACHFPGELEHIGSQAAARPAAS